MSGLASADGANGVASTKEPGPASRPAARLGQADLIRAVALLLVVVIHCDAWPRQQGGFASVLYPELDLLARVSLPLFLVLSGVLLAYRHDGSRPDPGFLIRRLRRTLAPWLIWAVIYFGATVAFTGMSADPRQSWGWWAGGAGHLYFLILLPQLYLMFLVWPKGRTGSAVALVASLVVQVGLQLARVLLPLHGGLGTALLLNYGFEEAPFWVGYFGLGIFFGLRLTQLGKPSVLLWAALPAAAAAALLLSAGLPGRIANHWGPWVGGTGAFLRPSLLLLTAVVFLSLWQSAPWILSRGGAWLNRLSQALSRHSLGIYILHPLVLFGVGPLLRAAPGPLTLDQSLPGSLLPFSLLIISVTGVAWAATRVLTRSRFTAWAVGEVAPRLGTRPA